MAVLIVVSATRIPAQPATAPFDSSAIPTAPNLGSYLNPDGTLNLGHGFSGSIDARGWGLSVDGSGAPRFEPLAMLPDSTIDSTLDTTGTIVGDAGWDNRFGPPGPSGIVYAVAVIGDEVYVGGRFNTIGTLRANNIASWNRKTHQWSTLERGVAGEVRALTVADGALYVGGVFTAASGLVANGIAKWDPGTGIWSAFGTGVFLLAGSAGRGGDVYAIAVHGQQIFIAGNFIVTDDNNVRNLAMWNGSKWGAIDRARLPNGNSNYTLAVRGDDLFIGGTFTKMGKLDLPYIAQFNIPTAMWTPVGGGTNGSVRAIVVSGPDLYVGGDFTKAGAVNASHLARWDGAAWNPVGQGVDGRVYSIAVDRSDVYVGGELTNVAGLTANCIAKWNGGSWSMMGVGMGLTANGATQWVGTLAQSSVMTAAEEGPPAIPYVWALAAVDGEVYAGGHFTSAGSVSAHHVAFWNGKNWEQMIDSTGGVLNYNGTDAPVYAMAVDGDNVYLGGDFSVVGGVSARRVVKWNRATRTWSALGGGIDGDVSLVRTLAFSGGDLYAGGIFDSAGGVPARGIARWNGTAWSPVGGGVGGDNPYVFALAIRGDDLFAGGSFSSAGGVPARCIARFGRTAGTWAALDSGIANETNSAYVTALAVRGNDLFVGGGFSQAGSIHANNIAIWSGTDWRALGSGVFNGTDGPVRSLAVTASGKLYAGGEFQNANGHAAPYLAFWNDSLWSAPAGAPNGPVQSLLVSGADLYAGGRFTRAGGGAAGHFARLSGSTWSAVGTGINGYVNALATAGGDLYAAGEFSTASGSYARNITSISGSAWSSLGADPQNGVYDVITALAVHGGDVYVGGLFNTVGGVHTGAFARWDGQRWFPVAPELNGPVRAIAVDDQGGVYVGGQFTMAGTVPVKGLAYWNGSQWSALGTGIDGVLPYVYALGVSNGSLYAGGAFSTAGPYRSNHVARWNIGARQWEPMGGGVDGNSYITYVSTIAVAGNDVYVGGVFPGVGAIKSENVARWDGTAWNNVGGGVNNSVYVVAVGPTGQVLVGGDFRATADQGYAYMASWDGTRWNGFPGPFRGPVTMIAANTKDIFVSGTFLYLSDVQTQGLARWDGYAWRNVGRGPALDYAAGTIYAMVASGKDLYVGGNFSLAGGNPSFNFGHWYGSEAASVKVAPLANERVDLLEDIIPNPCSASATVRFTMPKAGTATLTIFNNRGEAVETLASGQFEAGDHEIRWEPHDQPDGVYYCRMYGNGAVATSKVILMGGAR